MKITQIEHVQYNKYRSNIFVRSPINEILQYFVYCNVVMHYYNELYSNNAMMLLVHSLFRKCMYIPLKFLYINITTLTMSPIFLYYFL